MKSQNLEKLVYAGVIAAIYVVLTIAFKPISFSVIQFRISEILVILPIFTFSAVPGVFIGCLLANALVGAHILDIIFGSLASLIGAYGTYKLRKKPFIASLAPIISNALIIPFVLRYAYGAKELILFMVFTVGLGEIVVVGILGNIFRLILEKYKLIIFRNSLD